MKATTKLRAMLAEGRLIVAPFCADAGAAKIAEAVGFQAVYMSGSMTSGTKGYPDVGLLTMTEMTQNAKYIANSIDIPVIADSDNAYGSPINCWRTVREYEMAGVGGIHIEDQTFPKKCGFFEGKAVIPLDDGVQKIRAALDARTDPDFVIIARCDALAVNGWEDTAARCRAYIDAGADLIFVDGIRTEEDILTYAKELEDLPRFYNGGVLHPPEVEKLGFKINITGGGNALAAVWDAFVELYETGRVTHNSRSNRPTRTEVLGLQGIYEMEREYGVKNAIPEELSSRSPRFRG